MVRIRFVLSHRCLSVSFINLQIQLAPPQKCFTDSGSLDTDLIQCPSSYVGLKDSLDQSCM